MKSLRVWGIVAAGLLATPAWADEAQGCKDHPLFNRLPNYEIFECREMEFDAFSFPIAESEGCDDFRKQSIEGRRTFLRYAVKEGVTPASPLQVQRNFKAAIARAGGTIVADSADWDDGNALCFDGNHAPYATVFKLTKGATEVWVSESPTDDGYALNIVEREAMKQDIVANELLERINKDGYVALYINFDTGKATIKPDSQKVIDEVAAMLQSAPDLKIEIGGHTDNVGKPADNQKLSEARGQSVQSALVAKGIAAARLGAKGYGDTRPVADNRTEEGRAKNRRVELTKK